VFFCLVAIFYVTLKASRPAYTRGLYLIPMGSLGNVATLFSRKVLEIRGKLRFDAPDLLLSYVFYYETTTVLATLKSQFVGTLSIVSLENLCFKPAGRGSLGFTHTVKFRNT